MWANFRHILGVSVAMAGSTFGAFAQAATVNLTHWRAMDCAAYNQIVTSLKSGDVLEYDFPEGKQTKIIARDIGHGGFNEVVLLTTGKTLRLPIHNEGLFEALVPFLEAYQIFSTKTKLSLVKVDKAASHPPDYIESDFLDIFTVKNEKLSLKNFLPGIENGFRADYFEKLGISDQKLIRHMEEKFYEFIKNSAIIKYAWDFEPNQVVWVAAQDDWVILDFGYPPTLFDPREEAKGERQESMLDLFYPEARPAFYSHLEHLIQEERQRITVEEMGCDPLLATLREPVPTQPVH